MRLEVSFFENTGEGNQCYQVAAQSVLKHFLKKEYSLDNLDRMTGRMEGQWTWTPQIVPLLQQLGLEAMYSTTQHLEAFAEGKEGIRRLYGPQANNMLAITNLSALQRAVQTLLETKQYEVRDVPFQEVESALEKGYVPLMLIDSNVLEGTQGPYQGHFIVVTGFDGDHVFYHESGPRNSQPHRKVAKQRFIQAWESFGTDKDLIIVRGPKSSNHLY